MERSSSSQPTSTTQKNGTEEQGTEGRILAVLTPLKREISISGTLMTTEKHLQKAEGVT